MTASLQLIKLWIFLIIQQELNFIFVVFLCYITSCRFVHYFLAILLWYIRIWFSNRWFLSLLSFTNFMNLLDCFSEILIISYFYLIFKLCFQNYVLLSRYSSKQKVTLKIKIFNYKYHLYPFVALTIQVFLFQLCFSKFQVKLVYFACAFISLMIFLFFPL